VRAGDFTRAAVALKISLTPKPLVFDSFRKLYELLEPKQRRRAFGLLCMTLLLGLMEMASVGSIMPFVTVLANPDFAEANPYLSDIYHRLGFRTSNQFILFIGVLVFAFAIGVTVFKAITTWVTLRFIRTQSYLLSYRLLQGYLHQPYEWFLGKHSSDLGRTVLGEVQSVISGSLNPALKLVTQAVIAACLVGLLLIVDPLLAVIVAVLFGGAYGLVLWVSRKHVVRIGVDRLAANRERFRISNEALGSIKDIKILGLENKFLRRFDKPSRRLVRHAANSQIIAQLPQYAMQILSLIAVMLIVLYQLHVHGSLGPALPVIAEYLAAGQRLQPAFNQAYVSLTSLRFHKPALDHLHQDLLGEKRDDEFAEPETRLAGLGPIELRDISYRYPGATRPAVQNISLVIPARATVGLVGRTGGGKTTTVDLMLGLLDPTHGELLVDGTPIGRGNRRAWQNCLGYVPQQIALVDDSVAANIAFGMARDRIDMTAVEQAARIANLHKFVMEELRQGYDTAIGERGVRLSGGQRQRVGIARALYRDPDVLILDEATSALDNITERAVMDAVGNLAHRKTIILIAHRLTTVQHCDIIFVFESGRVVASGTYGELATSTDSFRAMLESVAGQRNEKTEDDARDPYQRPTVL
jgi:ABC-type multidrug transport system fused ATPase/permease subunit